MTSALAIATSAARRCSATPRKRGSWCADSLRVINASPTSAIEMSPRSSSYSNGLLLAFLGLVVPDPGVPVGRVREVAVGLEHAVVGVPGPRQAERAGAAGHRVRDER